MTDPIDGRTTLAERIRAFIESDGHTESFDALALDVHAWQCTHDLVARALHTHAPTTWTEIAPIPVALFKALEVGTVQPAEAGTTFRTSGTTGGGRGVHRLRDTALYDLGSQRHFRACLPSAPRDGIALLVDPSHAPDSSLGHMVALLMDRCTWHWQDDQLDRQGLRTRIQAAADPLFVSTTAFALAEWLEGPVPTLPAGSVLMVTGGFKGRVHRLDGAALLAMARAQLTPASVVTEYGMTELSSQLWGTPDTPFVAPAWMRVVAVDPWSGQPLPPGRAGQLRFCDLCNLDSAIVIDTLDEGIVHEDGTVTLHGRLPGAPARGCSLTVEDAWVRR